MRTIPSFILEKLNEPQKAAVTAPDVPLLIVAGPGSGKTRVIAHRIAFLLARGIKPQRILAVTFTNKAARELGERVAALLGQPTFRMPYLGTFHSICARILRREIKELGFDPDFSIFDDDDAERALREVLRQAGLDPRKLHPRAILAEISRAKVELIDERTYAAAAETAWQRRVAELWPRYQEFLRRQNACDFDDLLVHTIAIFRSAPSITARYQELFHHILIDEYQDTSPAEYTLIRILAQQHQRVFAVGDSDQAIYNFRGADFRNILNFQRDWPAARIIKLEQNYRSTTSILEAAQSLISHNTMRTPKGLWTTNGEGTPPTISHVENEREEGLFLLRAIDQWIGQPGRNLRDCVVLYRVNAQSRALEEAFLAAGLPYRIVGTVAFFARREIRDILAYLKLLRNPEDHISLSRIVNVPPRGIGEKTLEKLERGEVSPKLAAFFAMLEELRKAAKDLPPTDLIAVVSEKTGYKEWLCDGTLAGESRWENVRELRSVAARHGSLASFLEEVSLVSDQDDLGRGEGSSKDAVHLMTLHTAKGLEFPFVAIVGLEEGLLPHARSLESGEELEEERRLCYVGMTRAREHLLLTFTKSRLLYGSIVANPPSRFLSELPEHLTRELQGSFDTGNGEHPNLENNA